MFLETSLPVFLSCSLFNFVDQLIVFKLFNSWKGSIYKLLWPNLVVYVLLYYILYFVYLFALNETQQMWVNFLLFDELFLLRKQLPNYVLNVKWNFSRIICICKLCLMVKIFCCRKRNSLSGFFFLCCSSTHRMLLACRMHVHILLDNYSALEQWKSVVRF